MEELTIEPIKATTANEEQSNDAQMDSNVLSELDHIETTQNIEQTEEEHSDETENAGDSITQEDEKRFKLMSRENLLNELKKIIGENKIIEAKQLIALIRLNFINQSNVLKKELLNKFIESGGAKDDFNYEIDAIEQEFYDIHNAIKKEYQKIKDQQEQIKSDNLKKKQEVLNKLKELIESEESLKTTYDEFKNLQDKWKDIGQVPRQEINNLWQSYNFLVEKFFDKVKINRELRDLDMKKNLEAKIALCEKVEELLLEDSINKSFKLLQEYHDQWRETGPVSTDKKDELWERFKTASDKINAKRKKYYDDLQEAQEQHLLAKMALCEKIEELLNKECNTIKNYNETTKEIDEMLNLWKGIGKAAPTKNDEVWTRFKSSINDFFDKKKDFFKKLKDEQLENYNQKLNLCIEAEAIAEREDWKKATQELLKLQEEWKKIGPVSQKLSDKIWKRFRAACDKFFENKAAFFKNAKSDQTKNLEAKTTLLEEIENAEFGAEHTENLDKLKEFQRRWMEIGFVPMTEKERLQTAYRTAINALLDKLDILPEELRSNAFAGKLSSFANKIAETGNKLIDKEILNMKHKSSKIKEEILLLENNIHFISKSKNADILRQEVEHKIQSLKQEIALIDAKIKMAQKQQN